MITKTSFVWLILFLAFQSAISQVASGGGYTLNQQVVANGGGTSGGGTYGVEGTIAQSIAGTNSNAGSYVINGGFWQPPLLPTAAPVTVWGKVMTSEGVGIRGVRLKLTGTDGIVHTSQSNQFGYFQFESVQVGKMYLLSATSKEYQFAPSVLTVFDSIEDLRVVALP